MAYAQGWRGGAHATQTFINGKVTDATKSESI